MQITFQHNRKSLAVPVDTPAEVKLYAVPQDYSEDGYFAAVWMPQVLEPVPACAAAKAELLAHIKVTAQENGRAALAAVYRKEGVSYAAS